MLGMMGAAAGMFGGGEGGGMPGMSSSSSASNDGGNVELGGVGFGDSSVTLGKDNSMMVIGILAAAAVVGLAVWKR